MGRESKDLMGATAEPIILSILNEGDSYGYEIVQKAKELSNGVLKWRDGSIYPVLKKLTNEGMISSYWRTMENERHRKYYTLLEPGKELLCQKQMEWKTLHAMFEGLWGLQPG